MLTGLKGENVTVEAVNQEIEYVLDEYKTKSAALLEEKRERLRALKAFLKVLKTEKPR